MSGAPPNLTPARARAISRWSMALAGLNFAYLMISGVQLFTHLMLNPVSVAPPTLVLTIDSWAFWRYNLAVLNLLPAAIFGYVAATACGCRSRPNIGAVVIGIFHFVWCLIVLAFTVMDLVHCSTTPWCSVPLGGARSWWFLIWFIAHIVALAMEFLLIVFAGMLYSATRGACGRRCIAYGYGAGAGYAAGSMTPGGLGVSGGIGVGAGGMGGVGGGYGTGGIGGGGQLEEGDIGGGTDDTTSFGAEAPRTPSGIVLVGMPMTQGARAEEARLRAAAASALAADASDPLALGADAISEIARLHRPLPSVGRSGGRKGE